MYAYRLVPRRKSAAYCNSFVPLTAFVCAAGQIYARNVCGNAKLSVSR